MKIKLYIAYGSNMDVRQMSFRCPTAKLIGPSEVEGYRLLFKGSRAGAYATIEPNEGSKVPVLIWEIGKSDEDSLDRYEGFPTLYYKKDLTISVNGKSETAMIYIMDERRPFGKPSATWGRVNWSRWRWRSTAPRPGVAAPAPAVSNWGGSRWS